MQHRLHAVCSASPAAASQTALLPWNHHCCLSKCHPSLSNNIQRLDTILKFTCYLELVFLLLLARRPSPRPALQSVPPQQQLEPLTPAAAGA